MESPICSPIECLFLSEMMHVLGDRVIETRSYSFLINLPVSECFSGKRAWISRHVCRCHGHLELPPAAMEISVPGCSVCPSLCVGLTPGLRHGSQVCLRVAARRVRVYVCARVCVREENVRPSSH